MSRAMILMAAVLAATSASAQVPDPFPNLSQRSAARPLVRIGPALQMAVARKLAVVLHRMWSDKTEFRFGKELAPAIMAA